ncbi:hypothetical protein [Amnibacterium endophyticum]|uniref:DUF2273 domain-containing protein n=1 Tax=Amnibacterium endophyticum TaxID=2109337 RepID=A0ABW4LEX9_9MICO
MTPTQTGMAIGAVLAITWAAFGFWVFVGVAVAIAIGALVGRWVEGRFDPSSLIAAVSGRRSSS